MDTVHNTTTIINTESLWFRIVTFIATLLFVFIFIVNAFYFYKARSGVCTNISSQEALTLLWINIFLAIVAIIVFVWSLIRLFFHPASRQRGVTAVKRVLQSTDTYVVNPNKPGVVVKKTTTTTATRPAVVARPTVTVVKPFIGPPGPGLTAPVMSRPLDGSVPVRKRVQIDQTATTISPGTGVTRQVVTKQGPPSNRTTTTTTYVPQT